jgi:hypothetical protein
MDATYKTNNRLLPLVTILVIDAEGRGRPAFHAFVKHENAVTITDVLKDFTETYHNQETQLVLIDKDFSEMSALADILPGARVNLCSFHVSQAVQRWLRSKKLDEDTISRLHELFMRQVYVESIAEFEELKDEMSREMGNTCLNYFQKWWSNAQMWASAFNRDTCNLGIKTTNHVESYHQKIKTFIHAQMSLPETIKQLMRFDEQSIACMRNEETIASFTRAYNVCFPDDEDRELSTNLTVYGQELLRKQIALSRNTKYSIAEEKESGVFSVTFGNQPPHHTSIVQCDCAFMRRFRLPCRHIFSLRSHCKLTLVDISSVNPRFLKVSPSSAIESKQASTSWSVIHKAPMKKSMSAEDKYGKCKEIMREMTSYLPLCGQVDFVAKCGVLKHLLHGWKNGKNFIPVVRK